MLLILLGNLQGLYLSLVQTNKLSTIRQVPVDFLKTSLICEN